MLLEVLEEARACTICTDSLPLGPRPILAASSSSRIVIVGQAPGTKVHASGVPWDDDSGRRLREWLQIDDAVFYDSERVALLPMGFCYPGRKGSGDAPPRPECAPTWHERVLSGLDSPRLVLLVGQYAQAHYLRSARQRTLTETVRLGEQYGALRFPLPHPAWRVRGWMKKNPWFETDVLPRLRTAVTEALDLQDPSPAT
ncbi:MAG: uracil-DNA glycosylase family protein [Deltaproteobacteria bacterium]|nr:uracil-DNA glycosylase family protein [Deltaproteobacteria bacterium]